MTPNPLTEFEIDQNSGIPTWIQVKNRLSYLIGSGAYQEGDQLPTVRALAIDLDISYNTVNRAYQDLEREGYISTAADEAPSFLSGRSAGPTAVPPRQWSW